MGVPPLLGLEDLTTRWLQAALATQLGGDARELDIEVERIEPLGAERGHLASVARVWLHPHHPLLPSTLVVKLASGATATFVRSWRLGRRECLFYSHLGTLPGSFAPRC